MNIGPEGVNKIADAFHKIQEAKSYQAKLDLMEAKRRNLELKNELMKRDLGMTDKNEAVNIPEDLL